MPTKLNASVKQYMNFYKQMTLGVAKAEVFLKDLEKEIKKFSVKQSTELIYNNVFDDTTYNFLPQDAYKLDHEIKKLIFKYYVLHSDLLYNDEYYDDYRYIFGTCEYYVDYFMEGSTLGTVIGIKNSAEKTKTLSKIFQLVAGENNLLTVENIDLEKFLQLLGEKIYYYCLLLDLDIGLMKDFINSISGINDFEIKKQIFNKIFNKNIDNFDILNYMISKIKLSFEYSDELLFNTQKQERDLVRNFIEIITRNSLIFSITDNTEFRYGVNFWFDKVVKDHYSNLELPKLENSKLKKKKKIEFEPFILKHLDVLHYDALKLKLNYVNKSYDINNYYKLDLLNFERLCFIYSAKGVAKKIKEFSFDYLSKESLFFDALEIKDNKIRTRLLNLKSLLLQLTAKKVFFHEKNFRTVLMGCFSYFYSSNEFGFEKTEKWIKNVKN